MQPWDVWIDTGGTFTDCVARAPDGGSLARAKVLSNGSLRAMLKRRLGPERLEIYHSWGACDDLINGCTVRAVDSPRMQTVTVKRFLASSSIVELDRPWHGVADGQTIEFRSQEPAPILATRLVTRTPAGSALPSIRMRLATTHGTNALLERRGSPVALFVTEGFGDLLHIGDQRRPSLFSLQIVKPQPLTSHIVEVFERMSVDGEVIRPLDLEHIRRVAPGLAALGIKAAAVGLLHSTTNPRHEIELEQALREAGFNFVSVSSKLSADAGLLDRTQTAAVDAYLGPLIETYLCGIQCAMTMVDSSRCPSKRLHVMTSAGGLSAASEYRACQSLLSGPAGGVNGARAAANAIGLGDVIAFDMGGTSTDVTRISGGQADLRFEHDIAGVRLNQPTLAIETVAAGGGSICRVLNGAFMVGPQSAGADPGPACYGAGGPLTITDVNLLLGRVDARRFSIPINPEAARRAAEAVIGAADFAGRENRQWPDVLDGFLRIANQRMASAIERASIRKGFDPREHALVAFGGAGAQHACDLADLLGMRTIVVPHDSSLLSAIGLGAAPLERLARRQVSMPIADAHTKLRPLLHELVGEASEKLELDRDVEVKLGVTLRVIFAVRLFGQDATLQVEVPQEAMEQPDLVDHVLRGFERAHVETFGHPAGTDERAVEIESACVVVQAPSDGAIPPEVDDERKFNDQDETKQHVYLEGRWTEVRVLGRNRLCGAESHEGPLLISDRHTTVLVAPGWTAHVHRSGSLILRRQSSVSPRKSPLQTVAAAELFSHRLMSIAQDMGQMLQRMAVSTNVKQRLDFSCAVIDADGDLIVNAPHIPVHLGALGACVRAVRQAIAMREGDVVITNHPRFGGSHLPDVSIVTPVIVGGRLVAYVANRAHHAEIGGSAPGSMPPDATSLDQEGVIIYPQLLLRAGEFQEHAIRQVLSQGRFPTRNLADNMNDIRAAVAANERGVQAIRALAAEIGTDQVAALMRTITARAAANVRNCLQQLGTIDVRGADQLDDRTPLAVHIRVKESKATFDFTGCGPVHQGNLNATTSIVRSAVMYVLRLMSAAADPDAPLNDGMLRDVEMVIPPGLLNPEFPESAQQCPAVVGGNTETSQRLVNLLLGTLGLLAGGQGTMNNVLFGNASFGYYETVCGGAGAGAGFHGASAVHTHMTNTRITDAEILERRCPVRVRQFGIRRGSGGIGQWNGGDGVIREIEFLEPLRLSVLTQHRLSGPAGLAGGGAGSPGSQHVVRANGRVQTLGSIDGIDVAYGDRLVLQTPGGGGFGTKHQ